MDITVYYVALLDVIKPILALSGWLALTISVIVMIINMIIDAFIGKGFRIGSR